MIPQLIELSQRCRNGENTTKKTDDEYQKEFETIQDKIKLRSLNEWSLFGQYLPPRRSDICNLKIRSSLDSEANHYNISTETFAFYNYKNKKTKGAQFFKLDLETFPFLNQELLNEIKAFLKSKVGTAICSSSVDNFSRVYRRRMASSCDMYRHYWATRAKQMDRKSHLAVANWMDHSIETSVKIYSHSLDDLLS